MIDYYIKAPNATSFWAKMSMFEVELDDGSTVIPQYTHDIAVDAGIPIVITPAVIDAEGNILTEAVMSNDYHVNIRLINLDLQVELEQALTSYLTPRPDTPQRKWINMGVLQGNIDPKTKVINDDGDNVNNTFVVDETNMVMQYLTSDGVSNNQNVLGSLASPVRFSSAVVPAGKIFLCARVMLYMEDSTNFSSTLFAGIPELPNGWQMEINGTAGISVKNNKDLAITMFDFTGNALFGKITQIALGRLSLNKITDGADGITIREGETFTTIVRDDLTDLDFLHVMVQGVYIDV